MTDVHLINKKLHYRKKVIGNLRLLSLYLCTFIKIKDGTKESRCVNNNGGFKGFHYQKVCKTVVCYL